MTDRELIARYRECQRRNGCEGCPQNDMLECFMTEINPDDMVDRLEALLAENERLKAGKDKNVPTKWVSVEERLPEMHAEIYDDIDGPHKFWRSETVLGADRDGAVYAVWCEQSMYGGMFWQDEPGNIYEITHWMPLPEHPSTEGVE